MLFLFPKTHSVRFWVPTLREFFGGRTIIPLYDKEESVCGINYNGESYYFIKNLQGDVTHITDEDGQTVAEYSYDAWGKPTTVSDTSTKSIAYYNPYRYRSYYYDVETGLYYLQSRYYDPEVGRFVNGDEVEYAINVACNITQHNLYAYCFNDVTNEIDPYGLWPEYYKTVTRRDINCYAYVLGLNKWRDIIGFNRYTTVQTLYDKVCKDLKMLKISYIKLGTSAYSKTFSNKYYLIAMRVGHGKVNNKHTDDYHFWVRHKNYMWSHKPGKCVSEFIGYERTHYPSNMDWNIISSYYEKNGVCYPVQYQRNFYNSKTYYLAVEKK